MKKILLKLSMICLPFLAQSQIIFSDDFETGNLNKWEQGAGSYQVRGATTYAPNNGTYSLQMTGQSNLTEGISKTFLPIQMDSFVFYYKSDTSPIVSTFIIGDSNAASNGGMINIQISHSSNNSTSKFSGDGGANTLTYINADSTWYKIIIRNINWSAKTYDINIPSIPFTSTSFPFYNNSTNYVSQMYIANTDSGTVYYDDITLFGTYAAPVITLEPVNAALCEGGDTSFNIASTTTDSILWQLNSGSGWANISNTNNDTLQLNGVTPAMNNYMYRSIVFNPSASDTSATAILTVNALTSIITESGNLTLCHYDSSLFGITAVGSSNSYKWQLNTGIGFGDIADASNDTLLVNGVIPAMNGNLYRVVATGTCNADTSSEMLLTVNNLPVISSITSSRNPSINGYTPFQCTDLTATATGAGSLSYDWSNAATGSVINVCPTVGTTYEVMVTDGNGCIETDTIRQSVMEATSPYPGRVIMCYNYPRRRPVNVNIYPNQVPQYLNAGATFGACGAVPSKRNFESDYSDIYSIYPNPAQNQVTVEWFSLFNEIVNIDLVDMTGRVVKNIFNGEVLEGNISLTTTDVSNLPAGMYFMRYSSPTDVRINKVQLMR